VRQGKTRDDSDDYPSCVSKRRADDTSALAAGILLTGDKIACCDRCASLNVEQQQLRRCRLPNAGLVVGDAPPPGGKWCFDCRRRCRWDSLLPSIGTYLLAPGANVFHHSWYGIASVALVFAQG
jgi:hypothetical protein